MLWAPKVARAPARAPFIPVGASMIRNATHVSLIIAILLAVYHMWQGWVWWGTSAAVHHPKDYSRKLEQIANREVQPRMKGIRHYMDYTGAAIAPESMLDEMCSIMKTSIHGNPHSMRSTKQSVERVRRRTLEWFGTWEGDGGYHLIWTSGATGAIKTVGETFQWSRYSWYVYLRESHNSVIGVREYALKANSTFRAACEGAISAWLNGSLSDEAFLGERPRQDKEHLLAYPGEENFSGAKYPLAWAEQANRKGWRVLLDAAALAQTHPPNLTQQKPDFVAVSFYKIFGAPTGLGALLIRDDAANSLRKTYWGGGTVDTASADEDIKQLKQRPAELLEDGTLNYLGVLSLEAALDWTMRNGGQKKLALHAHAVHHDALQRVSSLSHSNGQRLVRIYSHAGENGSYNASKQAPVIAFNLLDRAGELYDPQVVEERARESYGIHLRAGVHCNPGGAAAYCLHADRAEEIALGLCSEKELPEYARSDAAVSGKSSEFQGLVGCGCNAAEYVSRSFRDDANQSKVRFMDSSHDTFKHGEKLRGWVLDVERRSAQHMKHVQALRASFGPMSTLKDTNALSGFIQHAFQE